MRLGILISSLPRLTNQLVTMDARMPSKSPATLDGQQHQGPVENLASWHLRPSYLSQSRARSRPEDELLQATIVLHLPGSVYAGGSRHMHDAANLSKTTSQ